MESINNLTKLVNVDNNLINTVFNRTMKFLIELRDNSVVLIGNFRPNFSCGEIKIITL